MITFIFYFTIVLLSLIGQTQIKGCFIFKHKKSDNEIKPIFDPNDTIDVDPNVTKDDNLCNICCMEKKSVTLLPCGHTVGNFCANKFSISKTDCPFCTIKIKQFENMVNLSDIELDEHNPYRFRHLTEKELNRLKEKLKNGMTDEEIIARFWFLQRGQEPDRDLLKDIKNLKKLVNNKEIACLKKELLSNISNEIVLYRKKFKNFLKNDDEEAMLVKYFQRLLITDIVENITKRKTYTNTLPE
ncbi:uncharacterized protein LOC126904091 isoform X3 [Daktulosphaira vitifoliae]|uniref:uncharacterized protein LOC126904091 isoform X2 n=1 Tax=Daktulosphaira vitifoliae TaxID=58002 RepID=UPI0021AA5B1E|nr:uncharacterized protein LOC126904091 isoform X2 [Daktulosphaira vitifoliae]XP_050538769.1 uncharacterized protein LOC126904091 isoform X3 [Daktulosphaira vitifoliae]